MLAREWKGKEGGRKTLKKAFMHAKPVSWHSVDLPVGLSAFRLELCFYLFSFFFTQLSFSFICDEIKTVIPPPLIIRNKFSRPSLGSALFFFLSRSPYMDDRSPLYFIFMEMTHGAKLVDECELVDEIVDEILDECELADERRSVKQLLNTARGEKGHQT